MIGAVKREVLRSVGLGDPEHPWILRAARLRRRLMRTNEAHRDAYLRQAPSPRLQIGGGTNLLEGWLNTDLGLAPGVMTMDATRPFPFVFTEHMIEHVPFDAGAAMLRECYRVLQPGGVLRVVTPDLAAIVSLYAGDRTSVQQKYLTWFYDAFLPPEHPRTPTMAVNAMFRLWGHQFLYDEAALTGAMRAAGFRDIARQELGKSRHVELQGLEHTGRYPDDLLAFESVALEGRK